MTTARLPGTPSPRLGKAERHALGEPGDDPVGEPQHGGLLVDDHGDPEGASGERGRQRHEAAGGEEQRGPEPAQHLPRARDARGNAHAEVREVLPVPVAAELAGGDGVKRPSRLGNPLRLDPRAAADPVHVGFAALAERRRDGEAGARVSAGAASRDDDSHQALGSARRALQCGAGAGRDGQRRRSRPSSMRREINSG